MGTFCFFCLRSLTHDQFRQREKNKVRKGNSRIRNRSRSRTGHGSGLRNTKHEKVTCNTDFQLHHTQNNTIIVRKCTEYSSSKGSLHNSNLNFTNLCDIYIIYLILYLLERDRERPSWAPCPNVCHVL